MALVLPASGVAPNSTTWIGWWIQREEGWHTYWKHPGNVGITPHLEWTLPDRLIEVSNFSIHSPSGCRWQG